MKRKEEKKSIEGAGRRWAGVRERENKLSRGGHDRRGLGKSLGRPALSEVGLLEL